MLQASQQGLRTESSLPWDAVREPLAAQGLRRIGVGVSAQILRCVKALSYVRRRRPLVMMETTG